MEIVDIRGIPLYSGDIEDEYGVPDAVVALKERIASSKGLLIASPEYNRSLPGGLKNAIDWLSRPPADIPRVFHGKPVALIGASVGGSGTQNAQAAWLPVLDALGMRPWLADRLLLSRAAAQFDENSRLIDWSARAELRAFMEGFSRFALDFRLEVLSAHAADAVGALEPSAAA
jgi:NAD(P)H-dependent FMN reductase